MENTVRFTQMKNGTRDEYLMLREFERPHLEMTADRLVRKLERQADETLPGDQITRLQHAFQAATRAQQGGADADWIVSALMHDFGDGLAPQNHDRFAAEILRPFVREECTWVVEHPGAFQMVYYAHHYGWNQFEREKYKASPYFQTCVDFCERWDQSSFDPDHPMLPLSAFDAMVHDVFARKAYDPQVIQPGVVQGLPVVAG